MRAEELPYGPGNPDYEYDGRRQRALDDEMNAPASRIQFIEETHTYLLDGSAVPSVTTVIKPLVSMGGSESVREHKRQIGKALDAAIGITERGDEIDPESLDEAVVPFFQAWLKFKEESGFRVLLNQTVVYSAKMRYAGTLDMAGTRGDSDTPDELLDTKCVWDMDPATGVQTAGYALALPESHGVKVKKRGGVQLLRDGTYRYFPYTHPNDEHVFKACLAIHNWKALNK